MYKIVSFRYESVIQKNFFCPPPPPPPPITNPFLQPCISRRCLLVAVVLLTNVLPHRNAMPQTRDTTPHPVTVYRHGANLSLCYPSMWNVTLEYTATHFNVLGETRPGNPSPTFHTHQRTFNLMLSWWSTVGSSVESTVPTGSWTRDLWCANPVRYPLAHSDFLGTDLRWERGKKNCANFFLSLLHFKRIQFCTLVHLWFPIFTVLCAYFSLITMHWCICCYF